MKKMTLIEMNGFLKGECIPSDLKVNETNAEYLVRKFAELESKLETSLRECRSAGITIDNLEVKCATLAAENAWLKEICDDRRRFIMNGVQMGYIKVPTAETDPDLETIRIAISPQKPIPSTDSFLAEVLAQERTNFIGRIEWIIRNECNPDKTETILNELQSFADQLRKGGNQ